MSRPSDSPNNAAQPSRPRAQSRPSDHIDSAEVPNEPVLGLVGWLRWGWRQLTSMRLALVLLLLLALASIPGSLVPQRSADPNGVIAWQQADPTGAQILDALQLFDVYSSVWFSAIYLLLFISLIGCVIPRIKHHWQAMRSQPPKTPSRLQQLPAHRLVSVPADVIPDGTAPAAMIDAAEALLRSRRYRVRRDDRDATARGGERWSVSAERGYLRETGNLLFHLSLVGVLVTVWIGGTVGWTGQRVLVEGETFANVLSGYDSFRPGRITPVLPPYSITLDDFDVDYEEAQANALGKVLDYRASVTVRTPEGGTEQSVVRVNEPLRFGGTNVYLLGNGYAPRIIVRDPNGTAVFEQAVPFLPQDSSLTSMGVVKVPDGLSEQLGILANLYPTQAELDTGAYVSIYPDLINPVLTANVYVGDLGLNTGIPSNVYVLNTDGLTQVAGGQSGVRAVELRPGESAELPNGLGSIELVDVPRFVSFDIHWSPADGWVLLFAALSMLGLFAGLFVPRRRVWVAARRDGDALILEYAGLARGDDPGLEQAVAQIAEDHGLRVGLPS